MEEERPERQCGHAQNGDDRGFEAVMLTIVCRPCVGEFVIFEASLNNNKQMRNFGGQFEGVDELCEGSDTRSTNQDDGLVTSERTRSSNASGHKR